MMQIQTSNFLSLKWLEENLETLEACKMQAVTPLVSPNRNGLINPHSFLGHLWRFILPNRAENAEDLFLILSKMQTAFFFWKNEREKEPRAYLGLLKTSSWTYERGIELCREAKKLVLYERVKKQALQLLKMQDYVFHERDGLKGVENDLKITSLPFFIEDMAWIGFPKYPLETLMGILRGEYIPINIEQDFTRFAMRREALQSLSSFCETMEKAGAKDVWWHIGKLLIKCSPEALAKEDENCRFLKAALKRDKSIACNNTLYEVEGDPKELFFTYRFRIKGKGAHVLTLAKNRFFWKFYASLVSHSAWGIAPPKCDIINDCPQVALVERIDDSFFEMKLERMKDGYQNLSKLAQFVSWCVKQNKSPKYLELKDLGFDILGRLRSKVILEEGDFNPVNLEKLLFEASSGHLELYRKLIEISMLHTTREAAFFLEAMAHPDLDLNSKCLEYRIVHIDVLKRAKLLQAQIAANLINVENERKDAKIKEMLDMYRKSLAFGRFI